MSNILIVEDDQLLAQTIEDILDTEGFSCKIANCFEDALDLDFEDEFDLYLLDINLPSYSGIELLKTFRDNNINKPAIFLTSYKEKDILNQAFLSGCDDYIKKPFDNDELVLRLKAVLNRYNKNNNPIKISDNIIYDPKTKILQVDKIEHTLSNKLIKLIELFLEYKNSIVSKETIIQRLWDDEDEFSDGALRVYIAKLKSIVGKEKLENIKGVGYRLQV